LKDTQNLLKLLANYKYDVDDEKLGKTIH